MAKDPLAPSNLISASLLEALRDDARTLHASTVAIDGKAVLIRGASGRGKSGLALELMALGAVLVADDRTRLWMDNDRVMADVPDEIAGRIEARFVGILAARAIGPLPVALVIDMDTVETHRLPPHRRATLLEVSLPLLHMCETRHFPAAIIQYMRGGRSD